jgi:hypothetical protein
LKEFGGGEISLNNACKSIFRELAGD